MPNKSQKRFDFTVSVFSEDIAIPNKVRDEVNALMDDMRDGSRYLAATVIVSHPVETEHKTKRAPQ